MKLLLCIICLVSVAEAEDLYIAQSSAGSANGSSCANALAVTFYNSVGNWGAGAGKISAGDTAHLCGTITSQMTAQGSGSSGSPITVLFEPGAQLSVPYCPNNGCMTFNGVSYIVLDGGSTVTCGYVSGVDVPCNNGGINATANGTLLANQLPSQAIYATPCDNCEFKNLLIANMYVHTSTSDSIIDNASARCITVTGSNTTVHNNTMHDASWCMIDSYAQGDHDVSFYANEVYNIDHGFVLSGANFGANASGPFSFYGNHIHDYANWDTISNAYHHDGIHCYSANTSGNVLTAWYIYNNVFSGAEGDNVTGHIYIEGSSGPPCASSASPIYFFNNAILADHFSNPGNLGFYSGNPKAYNNTLTQSDATTGTMLQVDNGSGSVVNAAIQNNVISSATGILASIANTPTFTAGSPDYNIYRDAAGAGNDAFYCNTNRYTTAAFASWRTCAGNETHSSVQTDMKLLASGHPNVGSPVIAAGLNLTSLCSGALAALCSDALGVPRPASAAWDAGAYQYIPPPSGVTRGGPIATGGPLNN